MGTFAEYLATGRGKVAYSFQIEGCKYEFVTDSVMEGALGDGRYRVRGLLAEGIQIQESVYMAGAELNVSLSSLQITETDGPYRDAATEAFTGWTAAAPKTWLASGLAVSAADTDIGVMSQQAFTVGEYVHVGTEVWRIDALFPGTGIVGGVIDPDFIQVTRGLWLTTAQAFPALASGPTGSTPTVYEVSSQPASYAGRRVWLRGHGDSELGLGASGMVLFRGILGDNPTLTDSRSWSVSIEPRTKLLDAEIGQGGPGGTTLRGIYYPGRAPLTIGIQTYATSSSASALDTSYVVRLPGHFETQTAFVRALQALLDAAINAVGTYGTLSVYEDERGRWGLKLTTPAAGARFVSVGGGNPADGVFTGQLLQETTAITPVMTVATSHDYICGWSGDTGGGFSGSLPATAVRRVPRANYHPGLAYRGSDADVLAYPHTRFYLNVVAGLTTGSMTLTPPKINDSDPDPDPVQLPISTVSGLGYVQVADTDAWRIDRISTHGLSGFAASGPVQPTIDIAARYGSTSGCNLGSFLSAVVIESPNSANIGTTPWLTSDDIDVNQITIEVLRAIAGTPSLALRDYVLTKRRKLSEILTEELKLHGMFLCLDAEGRITAKQFAGDLSLTVGTVDELTHTPGDDFGSERLAPDGLVSEVDLKLGYIAADDKWATTWNFQSTNGAATTKSKGQKLEISPFIRSAAPLTAATDGLTVDQADARVQSVLKWFGSQYNVVTVPVAITQHALRLGDAVLVTIKQLPHGGVRGSTRAGTGLFQTRAIVVGRMWQYGDSPTGTLDLLVHGINVAGYGPTLRVLSASGSGTAWTLTCDDNFYGPRRFDATAVADASFFAAGYKVVVREWDAESPRRYTGTISSVVGDNVAIVFDAAFPGLGASTWNISFDAAQTVTVAQRVYCFLADPMGRIQYSDSTAAARALS